ncbi:MAG: sugar phosphate nucleotidyltransferase [Deltaproteobacteria bacterium]|nr:sugar phosphate nucleotidyltransferase [Deltaproteobacteria bacterium]
MRNSRDTLVMLLAGGVGSRLNILATKRAKPAVPFGGIYRIIDFTLSNIMNSDLEMVGVLTQYKPLSLMDHIGKGEYWNLYGRKRGIKILPPHTGEADSDWYKGTADAIYQNLAFMENYKPEKVLILSGDHIYKMNYEEMITFHEKKNADLTIAAMPVPFEEAHRFGVMIINESSEILEFQEKVKDPKSNLASMGIYVFNYRILCEELKNIVGGKKGFDFGKDIIPSMLGRYKLYCYKFNDYWRDVGTIDSYHSANMDCLTPSSGLDLYNWKLCTNPNEDRIGDKPPTFFGEFSITENSLISKGCIIEGEVRNSVISPGVKILKGAKVINSVIFSNTIIESGSIVTNCVIDKNVQIGTDCYIGEGENIPNKAFPNHLFNGITVIGKNAIIPDETIIGKNCIIYPEVILNNNNTGMIVNSGETVNFS